MAAFLFAAASPLIPRMRSLLRTPVRIRECSGRADSLPSPPDRTQYLGVARVANGWSARVDINRQQCYLGVASSPEQAARARDAAAALVAKALSKRSPRLNLPPPAPLAWREGLPPLGTLPLIRLRQELRVAVVDAGLLPPAEDLTDAGNSSSPDAGEEQAEHKVWRPRRARSMAIPTDDGVPCIGVHRRLRTMRADGTMVTQCQGKVHYDGRAINLGFFYSTVDAARGYDLCARVVAALGFPRRLNFPIDSALDAAAAAALAALPIPADELRASLAPASETPLKERLAIIRRVIRSIYVPGRHLRSPKASSFRGVSRNEKRWSARLQVGGRMKRLGTFKTEEEAARAYDTAAVAAGLTQRLNFPPTKQGA